MAEEECLKEATRKRAQEEEAAKRAAEDREKAEAARIAEEERLAEATALLKAASGSAIDEEATKTRAPAEVTANTFETKSATQAFHSAQVELIEELSKNK